MTPQLRALIGARVSVLKGDEKVSHIAQREAGEKWARNEGYDIVGYFEDLDVSARVSPFDRPDLGQWLARERADEWDVLVFAKVDRAFRSIRHCVDLARWCEEHGKILVFADDGLQLNFREKADRRSFAGMLAELFLILGSFFAQIELYRFQDRTIDAHRVLRHTDRWAGGVPPEGYCTAPHPSGKGRTLIKDGERQTILREAATWLLEGESFNGIAKRFNDKGYLTCRDYHRDPEKREGIRWTPGQIISMLTSPGTQGLKLHGRGRNTRPVLDDAGNPLRIAEPSFPEDIWAQIQAAVAERRLGPARRVNGASPMLDVVYCRCGAKARHKVSERSYGTYRYYQCSRLPDPCNGVSRRAEEVEALVEQTFLEELGDEKHKLRVFEPGSDVTAELERITGIIDSLREDRAMGLIRGADDEARFRTQMAALLDQRDKLQAQPQRAAGWRLVPTDQTYGDIWHRSDTEARRKLLVSAGVRFVLRGLNVWEIQIPDDIRGRLATP